MKRLALLLPLLACAITEPNPEDRGSESVSALAAGPIAAWAFDETNGSTASDAAGNGHAGTLAGQARVAGKFGNGLAFSSNMVTVPDAPDLRLTGSMTVEAWVLPPSNGYSFAFVGVVSKERTGSGDFCYQLMANTKTGSPRAEFWGSNGDRGVNSSVGLAGGTWSHVAMTYDKVSIKLYVNGTMVASKGYTQAIATSTRPLRIGRGTTGEWFKGTLDELRIYNRALSAGEIQADMVTPITNGGGGASDGSSDGATDGGAMDAAGGTTGSAGTGGTMGATGGTAGAAGTSGGAGGAAGMGTAGTGTGGTSTGGTGTGGAVYPIGISGHHFIDASGAPYLLTGDAAWSLAVGVTVEDADVYLANRASRGFNSVLVNLVEHKFAANAPANAYGELPFTGRLSGGAWDFSKPNDPYFAHVDQIIAEAASHGILVQLAAAYLGYQGGAEGWYTEMQANGTSRLAAYGTYLGNRYRSFPNIVWVAGGDYDPPDQSLTLAVENAIRAADPNHLHTAHGQEGVPPENVWRGTSWLSISNVYSYPFDGEAMISTMMRAEYATGIPAYLIESGYEHVPWYTGSEQQRRQQAWEAILNGGTGQNFGNEWLWPFGAPDVSGAVHDWRTQLDTASANDMGRLAAFFGSRRWYDLVPDTGGTFLTAGLGSGTSFASAALTPDGRLGVVYVPSSRTLTINMAKLAGTVTARWFDPATGSSTTIGSFAATGSRTFTPSGAADSVLVLEPS